MADAPTTPAAQPRPGNPLGVAALIVGAVPTVLGIVANALTPTIFTAGGTGGMQAFALVNLVVTVLIGLVAVALGVVGLLQRGRPRAAAGAGTALGAAAVVSSVAGSIATFAASAAQSF